jgi:hypothetical protein
MKLWKNKDFVVVDPSTDAYDHFIKQGYKEDKKIAAKERVEDPYRQEGDLIDIDALNKVQIEDMARQEFGVEMDRRWSLPRMKEQLAGLFAKAEKEGE